LPSSIFVNSSKMPNAPSKTSKGFICYLVWFQRNWPAAGILTFKTMIFIFFYQFNKILQF
jgi:hypothetical protein